MISLRTRPEIVNEYLNNKQITFQKFVKFRSKNRIKIDPENPTIEVDYIDEFRTNNNYASFKNYGVDVIILFNENNYQVLYSGNESEIVETILINIPFIMDHYSEMNEKNFDDITLEDIFGFKPFHFYCGKYHEDIDITCEHTVELSILAASDPKHESEGCRICRPLSNRLCGKEDCELCYLKSFANHQLFPLYCEDNELEAHEVYINSSKRIKLECQECGKKVSKPASTFKNCNDDTFPIHNCEWHYNLRKI